MHGLIAGVLAVSFAFSSAFAQFSGGVNVDINSASGAGAGQPTILFGGAAGQTGYWNPINPPYTNGLSRTIRDLGNSVNAVNCVFTITGAGTGTVSFNNANTLGDTELLLDDAHDLAGVGGSADYSFSSFAPGVYEVYTYAVAPDDASYRTRVLVYTNEANYGEQVVGGVIPPGGVFTQGVTHAKHTVALAQAGAISIQATTETGFGSVNGVQIKRLNPTRLYVGSIAGEVLIRDGLSWATSLGSLQWALAIAAATPSVTEIWVKQGNYPVDSYPAAAGSVNATYRLRSNLALYGGFAGTEATLAERPAVIHNTDTHLNGVFNTGVGRVNTVVTADGVGTTAVLDGFDIINGGTGTSAGGGILISNSSPRIRHCTLSENAATEGGGAYVEGTGDVLFQDCLFMRNTASGGSALRSFAGGATTVTLRRCAVIGNTGTLGTSGTIGVWCTLVMENCLVANNDGWSWIMDLSPSPSVTLVNCTLANNRATGQSGANPNVGIAVGHNNTIRNCIIWGNTGNDGGLPVMTGVLGYGAGDVVSVTDSIVQAWDGSLEPPSSLDFSVDPRFTTPVAAGNTADALTGDYHLRSRSPARDSGWDAAAPSGPDLGGFPRIVDDPYFPNTGFAGGTVDRGCYEGPSSSVPCPGDLGQAGGLPGADGIRDNNDFIVFINYFFFLNPLADVGIGGGFPGSDGAFDNNDFIAFIDLFFTECP